MKNAWHDGVDILYKKATDGDEFEAVKGVGSWVVVERREDEEDEVKCERKDEMLCCR